MRRALSIGLMVVLALATSACEQLAVGAHGTWMNSTTYIVGYECPTITSTSRYLDNALRDSVHQPDEVRGDLLLAYASVDQYLPSADRRSTQSLRRLLGSLESAAVAWSPAGPGPSETVRPDAAKQAMVYDLERYLDRLEAYC